MKFVDEYRDAKLVRSLTGTIARTTTRPWTIMEICGGQTHAIVKFGLDELLPKGVTLVHGPGCPVCVTPSELIDQAVELALHHGVILCTFGDMLRVPGSGIDLLTAKARGGDVRIVYSPLDAVAGAGYRFGYTTCTHRDAAFPMLTVPRTLLWENSCLDSNGVFSGSILNCQIRHAFDRVNGCRQHHAASQENGNGRL